MSSLRENEADLNDASPRDISEGDLVTIYEEILDDKKEAIRSPISPAVKNKLPVQMSYKLKNNVLRSTDFSSKSHSRRFGQITRPSKSKSKLSDIFIATEQMISIKSKAILCSVKDNKHFGEKSFARNMDSFREHVSR